MQPIPYLFFNGTCQEALTAYAEIFGGEIEMMMKMSDMPEGEWPVPEERKHWVMHAALKIGDGQLLASDDIEGNAPSMDGCNVMVDLPTNEEGRKVFEKLSEGGEVRMPYEPTFWAPGFGTCTDRFGIRWMISTSEPMPES